MKTYKLIINMLILTLSFPAISMKDRQIILPKEVWLQIIDYLNPNLMELVNKGSISQDLYDVCQSQKLISQAYKKSRHSDKTKYLKYNKKICTNDIWPNNEIKSNIKEHLIQAMLKAISDDDVHSVKELLKNGTKPEHRYIHLEGDPFLSCVRMGKVEIFRAFLEYQVSSTYKQKALMIALKKNHIEIMKILLEEEGVDPNASYYGLPPLLYITRSKSKPYSLEGMRTLLEHGANPNLTNGHGDSPLMFVVRGYELDIEVIRLLLEFGADPFLENYSKKSAYSVDCEYIRQEIDYFMDFVDSFYE